MIPPEHRPAVLMMVKDEADIIIKCLNYWVSIGVTDFYICDNGSTDSTNEQISYFSNNVPGVHITRTTDDDPTFAGERITNELKDKALADGHRWLFPADADEFLQLPARFDSLPDYLETFEHDPKPFAQQFKYLNMMPGGGTVWQEPHRKVFGWFDASMRIGIGNHHMCGMPLEENSAIFYKHYQYRTKEQFEHKMLNHGQAMEAMNATDNGYYLWYQAYKQDPRGWVRDKWNELLNAGLDESAPKWL